ncbi:nuclease-related domain-containing protein [uncultured Alistipes sp.]|uniref:nuclease-related domain-containing protein n=1 Tax=uncultured Alistipes sp. TaxID=538949 RepID=UPI00345DCD28
MIAVVAIIFSLCLIAVPLWNSYKDRRLLRTVTSPDRGTRSERHLVVKLLKRGIPSQAVFHDLYVRRQSGNYSQIDVATVTKAGIILFEVKEYSGWLFGKGYQSHWCQVLAYGKVKHRFYNPIKQNETHIASIRHCLRHCTGANFPVYSVIVFYGNCVFRDISCIPDNTFVIKPGVLPEVMDRILRRKADAACMNEGEAIRLLREAVMNGANPQIVAQHSQMVRSITNCH